MDINRSPCRTHTANERFGSWRKYPRRHRRSRRFRNVIKPRCRDTVFSFIKPLLWTFQSSFIAYTSILILNKLNHVVYNRSTYRISQTSTTSFFFQFLHPYERWEFSSSRIPRNMIGKLVHPSSFVEHQAIYAQLFIRPFLLLFLFCKPQTRDMISSKTTG